MAYKLTPKLHKKGSSRPNRAAQPVGYCGAKTGVTGFNIGGMISV